MMTKPQTAAVMPDTGKPKINPVQTGQPLGNSFPPPLKPEEEARFINLYTYGSTAEKKQAKNTLIEHNLRLVAHIVKKFHHPDVDDLISIGSIGLIKGISSFKPEKGTRLATYASRCIENGIYFHVTPF